MSSGPSMDGAGLLPWEPSAPAMLAAVRTIDSRTAFQASLRLAFAEAAALGAPELRLADADFALWPLGERAVVEALNRWVQPAHRRFHLLAATFDAIERLHPRWVAWRRQWAHRVECRANTEIETARLPVLLIAPGCYSLRLTDAVRCRGRVSHDAADIQADKEALDAALQQSHPAFPATVTGL